ncbi:MAG: PEP-CTERM sorting domain-containing protein [Verrucomicrobiae bacterium]|nr:PEP-CTERM sorting domain-containing protein [Verrucomicrobiae bacterium]NNJ43866.1 PEP-CTERM sorting domain-containing protein [Akkermansiaceae bacterium]
MIHSKLNKTITLGLTGLGLAAGTASAATALIDIASSAVVTDPAGDGKYWNTIGQADGALDHSITNMVDSANVATGFNLAIDVTNIDSGGVSGAGFGGTGVNGPSGADPFDEANVITDGIFNNNAGNGTAVFSFTGLAASSSYNFSAIGGRETNGDDGAIIILDAATSFLGNSAITTEVNYSLLNDGTVRDFSVTSNGSGEIFFEFRKASTGDTDGSATINGLSIEGAVVPEPSSTALIGLGGLALILRRRR